MTMRIRSLILALSLLILGAPVWAGSSGGATGGSSGPATALQSPVVIEGTADAFEGNFTFADPTVDWTCAWSATGQVSCPLGTSLLPTYSFGADTNSGFYSSGGDVVGLSLGGTLRYEWYTDGMQFYSGVGIIGIGSAGNTILGMIHSVEATTSGSGAPNVLLAGESRKVLTNEGASAENYHTLPSAVTGLEYTFFVQDTDGIRITAAAGDTIRPIAGTAASATGGFIRCATQGAFIRLVAINATEWVAVGSAGVWTIDV